MSILLVICGLVIFICAYRIGKHQGHAIGFQEGKACMLLELREQSLREGCCLFCNSSKYNISD
jgi:hypothetical protein